MPPHKPEEDSTKSPSNTQTPFDRFLEPATFVTVLSVGLYYIGFAYYATYFGRLGIARQSLDLPADFYVREDLNGIGQAMILFSLFIYIARANSTSRLYPFLGNLPYLAIAVLLVLLLARIGINTFDYYLVLIGAALCVFAYILESHNRKAVSRRLWTKGPLTRMLFLVFLLSMSGIISIIYGDLAATKMIEGSTSNALVIDFKLKPSLAAELQGQKLILIIHRDGKYFVTPAQVPAPASPKVYIIPDDQVEMAVTISSN